MEQLRQNQSAGGGPDAAHGPVDAKMDLPTKATSRVLPAISAALAIGIFILDAITITPAEVAVCVLYVGVVLLSARFLEKRGITLVSLGCIALTVLSYFLEPPEALPLAAISNRLLSVAAIGVTAFLAVQSKSREIVLRESEEKWKAVFENNPTMYFMVDGTGIILSVNPSGAEQLGYTADELIGRPVQSLFHEADREAAQRNIAICLERLGRAMSWELRKIRRDGAVLWVRETARAMQMKDQPVVLAACENVTERKRAEYLTGQVFETSPDAMFVIGRDYRCQRINPVCEQLWGMPPERTIGKCLADLVGTEVFEQRLKPNYDRCFAGEEVRYAEWVSYPLSRRYMVVTYSPLRLDSERVEAALVVARDLTDHVLASEALRAAQAELAHANRVATMGQLTASIAHELKQPLANVVMGGDASLRRLARHPPEIEAAKCSVERMIKNTHRAVDVIDRIHGLVRKNAPRTEAFDVNEAVLEVIGLTHGEVLKDNVTVQTHLADHLPRIHGDRVQLQQVMLNLIINAIQAMSGLAGGARDLQISTARTEPDGVRVAVWDTGPGLSAEQHERLFEPFYTTKPNGMGMGLSICRSIIEDHGGCLWASGHEPQGTLFQFTIPANGPVAKVLRFAAG